MAQKLLTGTSYFISFVNGQGAGAGTYVTYASDLDTNFVSIQNSVNQLVDETKSTLSSNSLLNADMLKFDDPVLSPFTVDHGVLGDHSCKTVVGSPTTELDISAGTVFVHDQRVTVGSPVTVVGNTGTLGTSTESVYLIIDQNSAFRLDTEDSIVNGPGSLAPGEAVIAVATWAGGTPEFTEVVRPLQLANLATVPDEVVPQPVAVFFDGDDYSAMLDRTASASAFTAKVFLTMDARVRAIERLLAGLTTDSETDAVGPATFGADITTPGMLVSTDGTAGAPAIRRSDDTNTGIRWGADGEMFLVSDAADVLKLTTDQFIDSATQPRFDFSRNATQSIATGTSLIVVTLDTETTDVGAWGSVSTTTLTVPTGGGGFYLLCLGGIYAANVTGDREIAVTLNGAGTVLADGMGRQRQTTTALGVSILSTMALLTLSAGDVLRLETAQDSGGGLNFQGRFSGIKLW